MDKNKVSRFLLAHDSPLCYTYFL